VIVDGTLIPIDRVARNKPFYSGTRSTGMNLQVIASPDGDILWVSGALPGSVHDKRPSGSGACWTNWKPRASSSWPIRDIRAVPGRRSPIRGRTSPSRRKRPTAPTRSSARPASARTRSSRPGQFSPSSAAALAHRESRQGHPHIAAPRGLTTLERAHRRGCRDLRREQAAAVPGSRHEVTRLEAGMRSCGRDREHVAAGAWADCCS
jgi:hypothetical protein